MLNIWVISFQLPLAMQCPTYLLMLYITREQEDAIVSLFTDKDWPLMRSGKDFYFRALVYARWFAFKIFMGHTPLLYNT